MSSLKSILNPDEGTAQCNSEQSTDVWSSHSNDSLLTLVPAHVSFTTNDKDEDEVTLAKSVPEMRNHPAHENCPDNLDCLPDTDERPQHTLPVILRCAILGSASKRLTIRDIYAAMENKYPYFRTAGATWKQSVRHHLSLNRLFERQNRPVTDPGFGSYWTVNLDAPPGTKRPRKRGRPNKDVGNTAGAAKRRGRPRKPYQESPSQSTTTLYSRDESYLQEDPVLSFQHPQAGPSHSPSPRLRMATFNDGPPPYRCVAVEHGSRYASTSQASDETFEYYDTEEDAPLLPSRSTGSLSPRRNSPSIRSLDRASYMSDGTPASNSVLLEQLHMEIQELRRQSSLASIHSARMTEELYAAKSEIERLRNRNQHLEKRLEDEISQRHFSFPEDHYNRLGLARGYGR